MKLRRLWAALAAGLLLTSCAGPAARETHTAPSRLAPAGNTTHWENNGYRLQVDTATGEFVLENKTNGFRWLSNPDGREEDKVAAGKYKMGLSSALSITYSDPEVGNISTSNTYTASVRKNGLTIIPLADGFKAEYRFPSEGFVIPLYVTLLPQGLRCEIPLAEIEETGKVRLFGVDMLPFMGAAGMTETGYLLVPDGSGALIRFQNLKQDYDSYEQKLYGRDYAYDAAQSKTVGQAARLPVFGLSRDSNGLLGIIREGDGRASIRADVAGKYTSYSAAWPSFEVRGMDTYAMGQSGGVNVKVVNIFEEGALPDETLSVDYRPLMNNEAGYVGMAAAYRQYLIDEKGLKKAEGRPSSVHLELLGGIEKKQSLLGIPVNRETAVTTYGQAQSILEDLYGQGLRDALMYYTGWSSDSIRQKPQVKAAASGALGGGKALSALTADAAERGYTLYLSIDLAQVKSWGGGYHRFGSAAKGISQAPIVRYFYDKATYFKNASVPPLYLTAPERQPAMLQDFLKKAARWNAPGVALETAGDMLYADFSDDQGVSRQKAAQMAARLAELCGQADKEVLLVGGNAYLTPGAGSVTDIPLDSSGYDVEDEAVPFYSLVFHGYAELSGTPINLADDPRALFLKEVETGGTPHFKLGKDGTALTNTRYDELFSIEYTDWRDTLLTYSRQIGPLLRKTAGQAITGHRLLVDGVTETAYENGITVIVNHTRQPVVWNGRTIGAQDFVIEGAES